MVEGARLESEYTSKAYRGFESLPLRQILDFCLIFWTRLDRENGRFSSFSASRQSGSVCANPIADQRRNYDREYDLLSSLRPGYVVWGKVYADQE